MSTTPPSFDPNSPSESNSMGSAGRQTERKFGPTGGQASGAVPQYPVGGYVYDPATQQYTPYVEGMVVAPGCYYYDVNSKQYTQFAPAGQPQQPQNQPPKAPHQDWYSQQAYQAAPPIAKASAARQLPNATAVLVLGIVSIATFWCYGIIGLASGIVALVLANGDLKKLKDNPEGYLGQGNLKAGRICAIIGIILSCLIVLFMIFYFLFIGALFTSIFRSLPH